MIINNNDLNKYNCVLGLFNLESSTNLNIKFIFKNNKEISYKNIAILLEDIKESNIKYANLNYSVKISNNKIEKINSNRYILDLSFDVLNICEDEKSITTTKNTIITMNSPKTCYANLELSATTNVISYTVKVNDTEIVVKNIKGNETVYIGSGKVIAGGKSKVHDVEIWEFPQLKPGVNNITVNRADVNLTIKYNERW